MASSINASTTAGVVTTADTSGVLNIQTAGVTAISIDASQAVSFTNAPTVTGGTANGVAYLNGSKVLTTGSALVFDGTNLGVGVTPSAWASAYKVLDVGNTASFYFDSSGAAVSNNSFINSSFQYRYKTSNAATRYEQTSAGQHQWFNAASGTAGNAITFTQAMTLDASGNLLVGTTSANGRLSIDSAGTTSATYIIFGRNSAASNKFTVRSDGAGFLDSSAWTYGSDATIKENIEYLEPSNCLSLLLNAKPAKFDYIEGQKANYGYIAQDVQEWLPEAVNETPNGKLGLQDGFINALGTGAIQALNQLIQEQQALIVSMRDELDALKAKVGA